MADRKPQLERITSTTGTTKGGAASVAIQNVHASAALTVDGVSIPAGKGVSFGGSPGDRIKQMAIDASSSDALITYLY